jgi:hypothetical protein
MCTAVLQQATAKTAADRHQLPTARAVAVTDKREGRKCETLALTFGQPEFQRWRAIAVLTKRLQQ